MANRLGVATSPYLRQHADNPVDWWEWGEDAFAEARRRDLPILLSVGYASCHWCHVMAHESFEDPAAAAYLNQRFVAVKVDREERPDVDAVYMEAVQGMTGQGGWPMTVFLTHDARPFYAGTYYPSAPRHGMPAFGQVLAGVSEAWTQRREEVEAAAGRITEALATPRGVAPGTSGPTAEDLAAACMTLQREFDPMEAGFGGAPKFPPSMVLEFLLRHHARTGDVDALTMTRRTCERMARGGMYDQLRGGFARYSVDRAWVVPHFEKMLYDNALLLRAYAHWWRAEHHPLAERVVRETAAFLLADLRTSQGGFASALDADTPVVGPEGRTRGVEGLTYVWTVDQVVSLLGPDDGDWAATLLGVTEEGTFEHGASTLQLRRDPEDVDRWARLKQRLSAARATRPQPERDDKVVAAWNGLAIAALADAGGLLEEPAWVEAAVACAQLLLAVHRQPDGRLRRTSLDGVAGSSGGVLEDYADVAEGFLALYAVTSDPTWLREAGGLLDLALTHFGDGEGGFFDTADDADPLVAQVRRPQDPTDAATPSGTSAVAGALLSYAALTGSATHRDAAEAALGAVGALARRQPRFVGWGLAVAEALVAGPLEIAVVGAPDDPATAALHRVALAARSPGAVVALGGPDPEAQSAVALLHHRDLVAGRPAAYVCRHFTCQAPVTDPAALAAQVDALH